MINIVCTSKPSDGLLYYSYEYCSYLNSIGCNSRLIIIPNPLFRLDDYVESIKFKYTTCDNIVLDDYYPESNDITLVLGRSMITIPYLDRLKYSQDNLFTLHTLFNNKIISVYSENHPIEYTHAINYFKPKQIIDLCDTEVYPNGVGDHFEKTINFSIYKPYKEEIQFKYLFLGTNKDYYRTVTSVIKDYPDYGILTYNENYINLNNNNIFAPVKNLLGIFKTYVYTKNTFDPAPRIFQECKYYNKDIIYLRDKTIVDGGSVYWKRDIKELDVTPILKAIEEFYER